MHDPHTHTQTHSHMHIYLCITLSLLQNENSGEDDCVAPLAFEIYIRQARHTCHNWEIKKELIRNIYL